MDYTINPNGRVLLDLDGDELLTLRHGLIEALEALGDREFLIRTGGAKQQAEEMLSKLKRASADLSAQEET